MGLEMKYFVLKPRAKTKHDVFAKASQTAIFSYADMIQETDSLLAEELRLWAMKEIAAQEAMEK